MNDVKVYSVQTGLVVKNLCGHTDLITSLSLNPNNSLQLFSTSLDGTIKLWDFNDGIQLKTFNLHLPILYFKISKQHKNFLFVVTKKKKSKGMRVAKFNIETLKNEKIVDENLECVGLGLSYDENTLVFATSSKLYCYSLIHKEIKFYSTKDTTCIAVSPSEAFVAVGSRSGKITLWYCIDVNNDIPVTSVLHWHAHDVYSIAFTSNGTYMLSGGEEGVLVLWQLATNHKDFLPRLGSEILSISVSPDESLFALIHKDNTIRLVSSLNLKIKKSIMGLKYSTISNNKSIGLVVEPRNNNIVLNGPGALQFYNPLSDSHILELEVAPRNKIAKREEKELIHPDITHISFSKDGLWMATIDKRDDEEFQLEVYLKFWSFDPNTQNYTLNTRIDLPHEDTITSLEICPAKTVNNTLLAVTSSLDKNFKIWELDTSKKESVHWKCRSVGFYKTIPALYATFSCDGSILAVSYGQLITLWDPFNNLLQAVLTYPPPTNEIKEMLFSSKGHFLYARSTKSVYVWDLLTCSIIWNLKIDTNGIAIDHQSENFLVYNENCFKIFSPKSSIALVEKNQKKISACKFYKSINDNNSSEIEDCSPVLIMDKNFSLLMFADSNKIEKEYQYSELTNGSDISKNKLQITPKKLQEPKNFYSDIYGKMKSFDFEKPTPSKEYNNENYISTSNILPADTPFIDIPSNVLPSPSLLLFPFLDSILKKKVVVSVPDNLEPEVEMKDESKVPDEDEQNDILLTTVNFGEMLKNSVFRK
ncbi:WD repeat-containing protein 75 [Lobulomyces angularis]|nr:WD repeat-containing protein 75 [Lobulomyces angularis]